MVLGTCFGVGSEQSMQPFPQHVQLHCTYCSVAISCNHLATKGAKGSGRLRCWTRYSRVFSSIFTPGSMVRL